MNAPSDTSLASHPDLSLGSFNASGISTPGRPLRVPSSSGPNLYALGTPSPPSNLPFSRKSSGAEGPIPVFRRGSSMLSQHQEEGDGGVLNTPEAEKKRWDPAGVQEPTTPKPGVTKSKAGRTSQAGSKVPTLRDQEKQIDNLKKENFDLKLKLHFLEERLAQLAPDQVEQALKQNINLKVEVQNQQREAKKTKKRVAELEKALQTANEERNLLQRELRDMDRSLARANGGQVDDPRDDEIRELELRNAELQADMEEMKDLVQEHMDERDRLQEMLAQKPASRSANASFVGDTGDKRLKKQVADLETDLQNLRDEAELQLSEARLREEELVDDLEALRVALEAAEHRREAEHAERSESRAMMYEEREARADAEDGFNAARDRLAAVQIELQEREDELAVKEEEIQQLVQQHEQIVDQLENDWRGEIEEAREHADQFRDKLAEKERECNNLEENLHELQDKTEAAIAHIDAESAEREAELEAANEEIKRLTEAALTLEEDGERLRDEFARAQAEDQDERERLHALNLALKEKRSELEEHLQEVSDQHDQLLQEIDAHRARQEELAGHIEDLVTELNTEKDSRTRLQQNLDDAAADHADALRRERRTLESKESALQSALSDLARVETALAQREADLQAIQQALSARDADARREGDEATSARFSLQLELDRFKRDCQRLEDDLVRARRDRDDRDDTRRERDAQLDRLHGEIRDLTSQLAAEKQARLNLSEKLDDTQSSLKSANEEANSAKKKLTDLEGRLGKEHRDLLNADKQYRDQLTERNTLLLTIYQYMERILGPDKVQKKGAAGETKPFTNFAVFHDNLLGRLKAITQIQLEFDKRVKDVETKHSEKIAELRKQLENRWKQIDKFEVSVKTLAEAKATWRRKMSSKEGELDALKQMNTELSAQLSSGRKPGGADPMEIRSLTSRATNAERRLNIAQNQLANAEDRLAAVNQRTSAADIKWDARVKEYEDRLKKAEEQYKRERQGSKESQAAYETQIKSLNRQKELAEKRNQQLQDILKQAKVDPPPR